MLFLLIINILTLIYTSLCSEIILSMTNVDQIIRISLQQYLMNADTSKIDQQQSSPNITDVFTINFQPPLINISNTYMAFNTSTGLRRLSQYKIFSINQIYNQPLKILLIQNNTLLIFSYKQHASSYSYQRDYQQQEEIISAFQLKSKLLNKNALCKKMDVGQKDGQYMILVLCFGTGTKPQIQVVWLNLIQNQQGYIKGLSFVNSTYLTTPKENYQQLQQKQNLNAGNNCKDYGIKYFDSITLGGKLFQKKSIIYCSFLSQTDKFPFIYYIDLGLNQIKVNSSPVNQSVTNCLNNASKIIPYSGGFLSVAPSTRFLSTVSLYQYFQSAPIRIATCQELFSVQKYKYIASHKTSSYISQQFSTIYILFDQQVIVKPSKASNYFIYYIDNNQCQLSSYALTTQYLYLFYTDPRFGSNTSMILVYSLNQRQFRLVDRIIQEGRLQYLTFLSVNNYLQRGGYLFAYDNFSDILSLQKYRGYQMIIQVKNSSKALGNFHLMIKTNNSQIDQNEEIYYSSQKINSYFSQNRRLEQNLLTKTQQDDYTLSIHITVRQFNDQTIKKIVPANKLDLDSSMFRINLNDYIIGPNPKFFIRNNKKAKHQYLNQYQTVDISPFLKFQDKRLLECSINNQLQQPVISFFYRGLYLISCQLYFSKVDLDFNVGNCIKPMSIKTQIDFPMHLIVLAQDKFLQYDILIVQICSITTTTQNNFCQKILNVSKDIKQNNFLINQIKIVNYIRNSNGSQLIETFLIGSNILIAANFQKGSSQNSKYVYTQPFNITKSQIPQLANMSIRNIYFDFGYSRYLMIHLVTQVFTQEYQFDYLNEQYENTRLSMILIYDKPLIIPQSRKYIGHLIASIKSSQIITAMCLTVQGKDMMIIAYQNQTNNTIKQYEITSSFQIFYRRSYPLYGRKIMRGGHHSTDGKQVYFQVYQGDKNSTRVNLTEFFVYSPKLQTTGVQSHSFFGKQTDKIMFIQIIGEKLTKSSIGLISNFIFTLCQPELIFQANDTNKLPTQLSDNINATITGQVELGLIDNTKLMSLMQIPFQIFNKNYRIKLLQNYKKINIQQDNSSYVFYLPVNQVQGPVMQYTLNITSCPFLSYKKYDIFTKKQCLVYINPHQYGQLLDFTSIQTYNNISIQIIVTDKYYVCVQNRVVIKKIQKQIASHDCNMTHKDQYQTFVTCVVNQKTKIYFIEIKDNCQSLNVSVILNPNWLNQYQYFHMKYQQPTAIFQIPFGATSSKIYYLSTFNSDSYQFSSQFSQLINKDQQSFTSSDYSIGNGYIWILQKGIGIYQAIVGQSKLQPFIWLSIASIQYMTAINPPYTYIDTILSLDSRSMKFQLGTPTHAYQIMMNKLDGSLQIIYTYQQIAHCYNNILSKSRTYQGIVVRMCNFQPQQFAIFGNFIPIENLQKKVYIQFYMKNLEKNSSYPFRMQVVNSNYYQINKGGYLVVGSIFNFVCYYSLDSNIKWQLNLQNINDKPKFYQQYSTMTNQQKLKVLQQYKMNKNQNNTICNATLTFSNVNFDIVYILQVQNVTPEDLSTAWRPWIYRGILILLSINLIRLFIQNKLQQKKIKKIIHHPRIQQDQFQIQVKINSKKSM